MKINLRVTFNDETVEEVSATARDLVAFEDKFTKSVASLETDFRITDLLWLAWHWLERQGKTKRRLKIGAMKSKLLKRVKQAQNNRVG